MGVRELSYGPEDETEAYFAQMYAAGRVDDLRKAIFLAAYGCLVKSDESLDRIN